ncbi:MAG: GNAT family N-acetyltransferase [candidate division Zixibacteria bacterium]|nr:GNAT family N-acetyltransferase [candidate division Zixibacteria bacterium]
MLIKRLQSGDEQLAKKIISQVKLQDKSTVIDAEHLTDLCDSKDTYVIAAFDDANPAAFLIAYLLPRLAELKPMMLFYEIEVLEKYHRRGIGTALIDKLKEYCQEIGICKMWVLTNESNIAAMKLYQSTGGKLAADDDMVMFVYKD